MVQPRSSTDVVPEATFLALGFLVAGLLVSEATLLDDGFLFSVSVISTTSLSDKLAMLLRDLDERAITSL